MKYVRKIVHSWTDIPEAMNVLLDGLWSEYNKGSIGEYRIWSVHADYKCEGQHYEVMVTFSEEERSDHPSTP